MKMQFVTKKKNKKRKTRWKEEEAEKEEEEEEEEGETDVWHKKRKYLYQIDAPEKTDQSRPNRA